MDVEKHADAGFAQQADSIDDGSRSTPERNNVKTIPKRGLAEMRRRMTNQCVERVKRQRAEVLSKLRCGSGQLHGSGPTQEEKLRVLQEVARDIVSMVRSEQEGTADMGADEQMGSERDPSLDTQDDESDCEDYLEMMRLVEEAVMAEILEQEQAQLQEYLDQEQEADAALLDSASREDEVACPVCLKSALHKHSTYFFCECGMRLNVCGDQLTLEQLKANLVAGFQDHSSTSCAAHPACAVQECGGYDMLIMACSDCEFLNVVA
eukprot:CAMPEP_0179415856 /NCGR_PEP_ID=MMETSP0799-20121207/6475_1 /TAXON_ID=46947 /ORGANISM="Geminigera cryophila, Strain CCMP2564" /LENGTH=264 /DNA_ID=CAMNT_0021188663 /DNA_START=171 /DNA_END=965 /DNA_ORIENTATION=-